MGKPLGEQVVVITGASQGIGREIAPDGAARRIARAGGSQHRGELAVQVDRLGGQAEVVATDVAEYDQVERLAARAVERFGRIDTGSTTPRSASTPPSSSSSPTRWTA